MSKDNKPFISKELVRIEWISEGGFCPDVPMLMKKGGQYEVAGWLAKNFVQQGRAKFVKPKKVKPEVKEG